VSRDIACIHVSVTTIRGALDNTQRQGGLSQDTNSRRRADRRSNGRAVRTDQSMRLTSVNTTRTPCDGKDDVTFERNCAEVSIRNT
jgi:hypothetical protein